MIMRIHIKNLRLRTIIGVEDWERRSPQDVIVNVAMEFDGTRATETDDVTDAVDYHAVKERITHEVEAASFHLLEALTAHIVEAAMEDPKVRKVTVEVDKPRALSFCDSVSVSCSAERKQ